MPKIGDIKKDKYYHEFIWLACPDCGMERWVLIYKGKPKFFYCHDCNNTRGKSKRQIIAYPIRSDKETYIQYYGLDLENHFDATDNHTYKDRIFCMDCPDFETCKGICWENCLNRIEVLEVIKECD